MSKVDVVSAPGEAGVTLITIGACVIYFAAIALFSPGLTFWSARATAIPTAFIVGAILIAAGAVVRAVSVKAQ